MTNMPSEKPSESPANLQRYLTLKDFGKRFFAETHVVKTGEIDKDDVVVVRQFVGEAITKTNSEVQASYFEHILLAPELGRRVAEAAKLENPEKIEFVLWLHDLGRLVNPAAYLRNDLIDERLLFEFQLPEDIRNLVPSIQSWLEAGVGLKLSNKQLAFEEELNPDQVKAADEFFESMSPMERIIYFSDCFGKRGETGIFDRKSFMEYLKSQEERYSGESLWPSIAWANTKRRDGAVLTSYVIEKTYGWLKDLGVDVEAIIKSLADYGPKFVILARHGEVANPGSIVYNRDSVMRPEETIHLSPDGLEQMNRLAKVIQKRKFRPVSLVSSPETRTIESMHKLNELLHIPEAHLKQSESVDEVYAPGPYRERVTTSEWEKMAGDAYDRGRWGKYNHEEVENVLKRVDGAFWEAASQLQVGETGIILSHGDPIAWWINHRASGRLPQPSKLRGMIYPNRGEAIVVIIDPEGKFFSHYLLTDASLIKGGTY